MALTETERQQAATMIVANYVPSAPAEVQRAAVDMVAESPVADSSHGRGSGACVAGQRPGPAPNLPAPARRGRAPRGGRRRGYDCV